MMKVLVFLLLVAVASGAQYSKCGWARILKAEQMDGHQGYSLANWVCLTEYESSFNTQKKNQNSNGSTDYGIFQINSRWWCSDGKTRSANTCGISCDVLLTNNIGVAIACAKRIPIRQWVAWSRRCSRMDLSSYLAECDL